MNPVKKQPFLPLPPAMERDVPEECPECGENDIVENWQQGNAECRDCGLVVAERLFDLGAEWRTFAQEEGEDPNRVGGPANPLLNGELGTDIGNIGNGCDWGSNSLNRAQYRGALSSSDKVMLSASGCIDNYCHRFSLPDAVGKRAKEFFKSYQDNLTLRVDGTRTRGLREDEVNEIVASSLFIACRNAKVTRSFKEICSLTMVSRRNVGSTVKKMEMAIPSAKTSYVPTTDDFVTRFCTNLDLSRDNMDAVAELSRKLHRGTLYGKTSPTVVASCIYVITMLSPAEQRPSVASIAGVCGVAEGTIRSMYKLMYPKLKDVIPRNVKSLKPPRKLALL